MWYIRKQSIELLSLLRELEVGKVKQKDISQRVNVIMENIQVITELTLLLKNFFRISPAAKKVNYL